LPPPRRDIPATPWNRHSPARNADAAATKQLGREHPLEDDVSPHPFPHALLSAIDLIEEIMRNLERDDADQIKLQAVVRAWEQRSFDGRPAPKAV
jgi:hypothetical protein